MKQKENQLQNLKRSELEIIVWIPWGKQSTWVIIAVRNFNIWVVFELPFSPITYAWEGGVMAFQDADMTKQVVTKKQYEEHGTAFCLDKFDTWLYLPLPSLIILQALSLMDTANKSL